MTHQMTQVQHQPSVRGVIDAIKYSAQHTDNHPYDDVELDKFVTEYLEKRIIAVTQQIYDTHNDVITQVTEKIKMRMTHANYYSRVAKALYAMKTPAAFDALVCLEQLRTLWRMRCTYRIALCKDTNYSADVF